MSDHNRGHVRTFNKGILLYANFILQIQKLRNHRTQLGLTQQETAQSIQKLTGRKISQTLISRFETNQLHPKNTVSLIPDLERWIRKSR